MILVENEKAGFQFYEHIFDKYSVESAGGNTDKIIRVLPEKIRELL